MNNDTRNFNKNSLGVSPLKSKLDKKSARLNQVKMDLSSETPMAMVKSSMGAPKNTKEIVTTYTSFPRYDVGDFTSFPVYNFAFNLDRAQLSSSDQAWSRVEGCRVYLLEPTDIGGTTADEAASLVIAYAGCPAEWTEDGLLKIAPVSNSSNVIKPSVDPKWIKILDYHASSVFDLTTVQPVVRNGSQNIAALALFDSLGDVALGTYQLCIEVDVAIPLGVQTEETISFSYDSDFTSVALGSTATIPVLTQYSKIQNKF